MRQLKITKSITNRETESFKIYLQEVSKIPLLSADDEIHLTGLIREGDKRALQKLINANLRFVISVAKQYQHQGLPLSDLINEGNIGLIKAAGRFDATKGFKFISYAIWWIRQSILQAITEQAKLIRVPNNQAGVNVKVNTAFNTLEQQNEREPSPEELAEILNMDLSDVMHSLSSNVRHISLDTPLETTEMSLVDVMEDSNVEKADTEMMHRQSLKIELARSLGTLTTVQKEVISYYFGIGMDRPLSLEDIGAKFDLTRERIRQIKDKAVAKLKYSAHASTLRAFL